MEMSNASASRSGNRRFLLKEDLSPREHADDIDISNLPALCLTDEVMEMAQEFNQDPKNLKLAARLADCMFKDNLKAKQILSTAVVDALALEEGILDEDDVEKFQQVPLNILNEMFEEVKDSPHNSLNIDVEDNLPYLDVISNPFEDIPRPSPSTTPREGSNNTGTIPKLLLKDKDKKKSPAPIAADFATSQQADNIIKLLMQQNSTICELQKSVVNLTEMVANLQCNVAELERRLEVREVRPVKQPVATLSCTSRGESPSEKSNICEQNFQAVKQEAIKEGVLSASSKTMDLFSDMARSLDDTFIKNIGETMGFILSACDIQKMKTIDFYSAKDCKEYVDILKNAKSRSTIPIVKEPVASNLNKGISTHATTLFSRRTRD